MLGFEPHPQSIRLRIGHFPPLIVTIFTPQNDDISPSKQSPGDEKHRRYFGGCHSYGWYVMADIPRCRQVSDAANAVSLRQWGRTINMECCKQRGCHGHQILVACHSYGCYLTTKKRILLIFKRWLYEKNFDKIACFRNFATQNELVSSRNQLAKTIFRFQSLPQTLTYLTPWI